MNIVQKNQKNSEAKRETVFVVTNTGCTHSVAAMGCNVAVKQWCYELVYAGSSPGAHNILQLCFFFARLGACVQ